VRGRQHAIGRDQRATADRLALLLEDREVGKLRRRGGRAADDAGPRDRLGGRRGGMRERRGTREDAQEQGGNRPDMAQVDDRRIVGNVRRPGGSFVRVRS